MKKVVILIMLMIISACGKEDSVMEIKLEDLQGQQYVISDLLGEKGTILYLSGTWVNSLNTLDYLNEQSANYSNNGIEAYFISISKESNKKVEYFINQHEMSLDYYADVDKQLVEKYDITTFPTTIFIDPYGNMEAIHGQEVKPEVLESIVNKWLESSPSESLSEVTPTVGKKNGTGGTVLRDIAVFYDSIINGQFDTAYDFLRVPFMPTKEEYIYFKENEPEKLIAYEIIDDLSEEGTGSTWKTFLVEKTYVANKGNEYMIEVVDEFSQDSTTGIWNYKGHYLNIKTIRLEAILEDSSGAYNPSFYFSLIGKSRDTIIHILGEPKESYEAEFETDQLSYLEYPKVFFELTPDFQVQSVALDITEAISTADIINLLGDPDYEDYLGENMEGSTYIGYEYNGYGIEFYFEGGNDKITTIVMQ